MIGSTDPHEFDGGYRGMVATEDIKKGDLIVYIPHAYLITKTVARTSPNVQILVEKGIQKSLYKASALFSIYLMEQRRLPDS